MRNLVIALMLACPSVGLADWIPLGSGQYLWTDLTGQPDGVVYGWSYGYYGASSYRIRDLTAAELQQFGGGQQPQANATATANNYGYEKPEQGWRTKLLQLAAQQQEHQQYMEAISRLGLKGAYGVESPYGPQNLQQIMASQYGGGQLSLQLGDLPLQQGNTVYGSYDPTYNSLADPLRTFDFGAVANQLMAMDAQREAGGVRLSSETRQTLSHMIESARILQETQLQYQGASSLLQQLKTFAQPSRTQNVQITTDAQGRTSVRPLDVPPVSGGPPPLPHPTEGGGAAPSPEEFKRLSLLIGERCLSCHGGTRTSDTSGKLTLGDGKSVDFSRISETQVDSIWKRVSAGTMPPAGEKPLSAAEKAVFGRFFAPLAPAGEPLPPPKQ